ncbi:MATE efflux family protein [Spiroplasma clarkii]|nr:MATE family efflux transporter [Spiroplasma clarkii]ARU92200.1 MATE efflux family protein [Spiroplasma clarkii]
MASTDLIDNIFVNMLLDVHIDGYDDFIGFIKNSGWNNISHEQLKVLGLESLYGDNIYYSPGQIGVNGVSASNQLFILMFAMVSGFCYGAGIFGAQYYGAGEYQKLKQITTLKIYIVLTITIIFVILGMPGIVEKMIGFTTHPKYAEAPTAALTNGASTAEIHQMYQYIQYRFAQLATEQGVKYYSIVSLSYPLLTINYVAITALRETRRPFYSFAMSFIALFANLMCNTFLTAPTFAGYNGFGILGVAFGTVASRTLQTVFVISLLSIKRFEFIPSWRHFKIDRLIVSSSLKKTLPILVNETLFVFGQVMQVKLRSEYSVDSLTANAMYETVLMAFFSPMYHGLNAGISTLVGNELGAQSFDKAKYNAKQLMRLSFMIAIGFMAIFSWLSFFIPGLIFRGSSSEAIRIGQWMIFAYAMTYPFILLNSCVYSILRAGGNVYSAFAMDSGFNWTFQIPTLAILILFNSHVNESNGFVKLDIIYIHVIICLFEVMKTIPAQIFYHKGKWVNNVIGDNDQDTEQTIKAKPAFKNFKREKV